MPFFKNKPPFFYTIQHAIPYFLEVGVIALSIRAGLLLWWNAHYFTDNKLAYGPLPHYIAPEWKWGALVIVASLCETVGYLGYFVKEQCTVDKLAVIRAVGWTASAVFWLSLGSIVMSFNPYVMGSGSMLLVGTLSLVAVFGGINRLGTADGR